MHIDQFIEKMLDDAKLSGVSTEQLKQRIDQVAASKQKQSGKLIDSYAMIVGMDSAGVSYREDGLCPPLVFPETPTPRQTQVIYSPLPKTDAINPTQPAQKAPPHPAMVTEPHERPQPFQRVGSIPDQSNGYVPPRPANHQKPLRMGRTDSAPTGSMKDVPNHLKPLRQSTFEARADLAQRADAYTTGQDIPGWKLPLRMGRPRYS